MEPRVSEALQVSEQLAEQAPDDLEAQLCAEPWLWMVEKWEIPTESSENDGEIDGKMEEKSWLLVTLVFISYSSTHNFEPADALSYVFVISPFFGRGDVERSYPRELISD